MLSRVPERPGRGHQSTGLLARYPHTCKRHLPEGVFCPEDAIYSRIDGVFRGKDTFWQMPLRRCLLGWCLHHHEQRAKGQHETGHGCEEHGQTVAARAECVDDSDDDAGDNNAEYHNDQAVKAVPENLKALEHDGAEHDAHEGEQDDGEGVELALVLLVIVLVVLFNIMVDCLEFTRGKSVILGLVIDFVVGLWLNLFLGLQLSL